MPLRTHLAALDATASLYPSRPVFKVPKLASPGSDEIEEWSSISYSQFKSDVDLYAKYWARTLAADGLPPRTTVGLWYVPSSAGYIPQLFSLRLPNPDVVYELLQRAHAKALIYEPSFANTVSDCPLPTHVALEVREEDVEGAVLPPREDPVNGDDIVVIFHTSGSTSGSPKLVPCNYTWLDAMISKAYHTTKPKNTGRQDVSVWMGSMCHIAQNFMLFGSIQHGSCTVQPTKIAFSSDELIDMVTRCGLNRLNQFATFLATQLRNSHHNPKLLGVLQNLDEVVYSGLMLPPDDERWAYDKEILLRNLFGNTECGAMLLSVGGRGADTRLLQPIEGTDYGFFPLSSASENKSEHVDANSQLLELVILSSSPDCPDRSLRNADGHYHTGDLFLELKPGHYIARGRDDDWIKSENSLRCDTKAIEDNVRATCGDLVSDCIVVGNGRPSPALFVEPKVDVSPEVLKRDIIRRIRHFHSRRYLHERITSAEFIFVVAKGTLPRTATKGNIRRKAVEEAYRAELDAVFGMSF
ncbi:hypothetical protein PHLCEN_2v8840 [Hermanssonia centrifuga]|uniref:AMP-dependent synthetase/ligase domain-containing protein n=1 Tax=Hermanssonia centrifuga TaxID=98765 RepID=A0A2R6NSM9_9APHY|nr:hypothetical protein PHLCEN_2v8840 [Hermanssonia centrifuga]